MQPRNFGRMQPRGPFGPPGPPRGAGLFGPPSMPHGQGMDRGGLLARLFQRQVPSQAGRSAAGLFSRAPQAGGGSLLQGFTNPGNIQSFLNNTQHVLKAAQQVGPLVQQYGPLVRNLPAMWRLYKGLKDAPETETPSENKPEISADESPQEESSDKKVSTPHKGESVPKLYI